MWPFLERLLSSFAVVNNVFGVSLNTLMVLAILRG